VLHIWFVARFGYMFLGMIVTFSTSSYSWLPSTLPTSSYGWSFLWLQTKIL
jgi:hypothetical protein